MSVVLNVFSFVFANLLLIETIHAIHNAVHNPKHKSLFIFTGLSLITGYIYSKLICRKF